MRLPRGMSFIDVVVGVALLLIIFLALTTLLRTALKVSMLAKVHGIAIATAESQMEYFRSLSYDTIGTVGGIPAGPVPQFATTTLNGVTMVTRSFVDYVDDPADGFAGSDSNGIPTDYKRAKISTTYSVSNVPHTVILISNFAPPGLETTTGGGTLKIAVVNAVGTPVPGATVRIVNASTTPTVDLATFSDVSGIVYLPGAATSSQYQVYVSKNGYSSTQTYVRDSVNLNPTPGYLTVAANQTTTGTFAIDFLSNLTIQTFSPIATSTFTDTFADASGLTAQSNTTIAAGGIALDGGPFTYAPSGSASSIVIAPPYLQSWVSASLTPTIPGGAGVSFHIRDASGALIPDTALVGNSGGLPLPVDLSSLSTATYPALKLSADLTTSTSTITPRIEDWTISYRQGPTPRPAIAFTLTGAKSIGTTGASVPIIKTTIASTTGTSSSVSLMPEWDSYALSMPGYDTISACNAPPYDLSPSETIVSQLVLSSSTPNSLLVNVDNGSVAVPGATVTLDRSGFTRTVTTDSCGSAYFGSLSSASDYALTVTKSGYTTVTESGIAVSGHPFHETLLGP